MLANVPWQHWAVIGEMWLSLFYLSEIIERGKMRYSWKRLLWVPWDLGFLGLFFWGLSGYGLNWAGLIFTFLQAWGLWAMVKYVHTHKEFTWDGEEEKTASVNGTIIMGIVMSLLVVFST